MKKSSVVSLIVLPAFLSGCVLQPDVGRTRSAIIDGRVAAEHEVGATVATLMDGALDCTGTLVSPRVVITAAHCLVDDAWEHTLDPSSLTIVVGAVDPTVATEEQSMSVSRVWVSPEFPGEELSEMGLYDEHDIGAMVLARDVTTVEPMPILEMASVDRELTGRRMLGVAGYGVTDRRARTDNSLLHVTELPFIERSDRELIAGDPGETDTCDGDSGGPAFVHTAEGPRVVGVNSRSVDAAREVCDTGSVFTLASAYAEAIAEAFGEDVTGHEPEAPGEMPGDGPPVMPTPDGDETGSRATPGAAASGCNAVVGLPSSPVWILGAVVLAVMVRRRR